MLARVVCLRILWHEACLVVKICDLAPVTENVWAGLTPIPS